MALEIGLMDDGIAVFVELPHFLLGKGGPLKVLPKGGMSKRDIHTEPVSA